MAHLSLALLGAFQIERDGHPVTGFESIKVRALLAYLALEADRPHRREALAGLLWPELPDMAARPNLRQALANLREAIGDATATPPFLLITRESIQFNPASDYGLDVAAFEALLTACETHTHRHRDRCRSCAARMAQAISLYRGDFLGRFALIDSAPFEEWQLQHREQLHQRALDVIVQLADHYERRGDGERARRYAQRQIELDPWREEAHRQLMRLLARGGQRSAALAQYETCRRVLARDLGVEPAVETTTLYERLRDGDLRIENAELSKPSTQKGFSLLTAHSSLLHNFPAQTTALIGREAELAELGALLENPAHRLITIVGPGGIGKTRLALAAAAEQAEAFANGATFVPLQAISEVAFVAPAILGALGVTLQGQRDPREQLLDELCAKELLLVLDNVEQLLALDHGDTEGLADLLAAILSRAPGVTLLITSRERLALPGEWLFQLPGLSYPAGEPSDAIEDYSSVRLFLQRARQVRRQFALAEGEADAVLRICRLVEGLPLAIELAAAALRLRSCTTIAAAIEASLSTLATGLRAIPERHRSIWATFEHSWRLLTDTEHQVLARLSVFRGGFVEDAAVQVAQASPQLLAALLDKSLLRWDGVGRYDIHELVRQYASEKLKERGEAGGTTYQHATYFLAWAEAAESEFHWGPIQALQFDQLAAEYDNLRAVLAWSCTDEGDVAIGLRVVGALPEFWMARGPFSGEGRAWFARVLERCRNDDPSLTEARAKALLGFGQLEWTRGEYVRANELLEQSLALYRKLENRAGEAYILLYLGRTAVALVDYARAIILEEQGLALFRDLEDQKGMLWAFLSLGDVALGQDDIPRATLYFQEAYLLSRHLGDNIAHAWALYNLGYIAIDQGDETAAYLSFMESLALFQDMGGNTEMAMCLVGIATLARVQGRMTRAAQLSGVAATVLNSGVREVEPLDQAHYDSVVATARAHLDETAFAAAWAAGQAMTLEQAIAYARDENESPAKQLRAG
jgi:predicted ATPase/DNA-binding SARP family transcriptional activator